MGCVVGRTFRDHEVPGLRFVQADLSSLKSARTVAQELPAEAFDLLVMTQGIFAGPTLKDPSFSLLACLRARIRASFRPPAVYTAEVTPWSTQPNPSPCRRLHPGRALRKLVAETVRIDLLVVEHGRSPARGYIDELQDREG